MFNRMVVIEPSSLVKSAIESLGKYAKEVVLYDDIPLDDDEIIRRIGDADGVLVSYTSTIGRHVIEACPNLRYIGMCCSLYSPESANVDIVAANERGIVVKGVLDYGDEGVVEYVISELVRYLHGFGEKMWKDEPVEITGLKVGIVGLGTSGTMIAQALSYLGAEISYYSRTRKPKQEGLGMKYMELHPLLRHVDVVFSCLNKNVYLFFDEEFKALGNHKMFFNTSIGPSFDSIALGSWLDEGSNEFFSDSFEGLGHDNKHLLNHGHVNVLGVSSGRTKQAFVRLSEKVLNNIERYFAEAV